MTSVRGTFSYYRYGEQAGIKMSCGGPLCDILTDFPETTCTTSGGNLTCSNGIECEKPIWQTDLSFDRADGPNALVQQNHITTLTKCDYKFKLTSDGKPFGLAVHDLSKSNGKCDMLIPVGVGSQSNTTAGNSSLPSMTRTGNSSLPSVTSRSSTAVFNSKAPYGLKSPRLFVILLFFGFLVPSLASEILPRGIIPAKPDDSIFHHSNIAKIFVSRSGLNPQRKGPC